MHNKNHDFEKPFVQEIDSPHSYEKMIEIYRFLTLDKLIVLILVVFGLKYAYDHRTEQVKETGVVIYHGRDQVKYKGSTLYFTYKGGNLKFYHGKNDWESENEAYILFQSWTNGSLREFEGMEFQRRSDFDYQTVAEAFMPPSDPNSIKFTTIIALPFFWTTLLGVILLVEPRAWIVLYAPFAFLPVRGVGIPDFPQFDPDLNYKLWGCVLLVISVLLMIPFGDQLGVIFRKLFQTS